MWLRKLEVQIFTRANIVSRSSCKPCLTIYADKFHHGVIKHGDYHTGMHKAVLDFVIKDPLFSSTLLSAKQTLLTLLTEERKCINVDISCRWGKQASVAWAIILEQMCYLELGLDDVHVKHCSMDMWTCGKPTAKTACHQCLSYLNQKAFLPLIAEAQLVWRSQP